MADTRVLPVSNVKYGLKAETSFGVGLDNTGADDTAFITQPAVQVEKPAFNILRESRLLSGRGLVKNAADTITNLRGGTVTMPFDMIATPKTLVQHAVLVAQENAHGSSLHEIEVDGSSNPSSIGGSITSGMPHSASLAYYPAAGEGIRVDGVVCSDLTITGDVASNNGLVSMSGNYFSGFSNPVATSTSLEHTFGGSWVDAQTQYFNVLDFDTRVLTVEGNAAQNFIMKSFTFNISNGVNRVGADTNGNAELYAFPEYVITGSMTIKYDDLFDYSDGTNVIQDFLDGDTLALNLICGDSEPDAAGEMEITAQIQYTGDPGQDLSESGVFHTLEFECVQNGANEAFKLQVYEATALTAM